MTDGGALLVAKGLEKRYDVPVIEGVDLTPPGCLF